MDPKLSMTHNFFQPNFFWPQMHWTFYYFGQIVFLDSNSFGLSCFTQNFFGLKFFWNQIFLEQDFIDRNRNLGIKTAEHG